MMNNNFVCFFYVCVLMSIMGCVGKKNKTLNDVSFPIIIDINEALRNKIGYKLSDIVDSIAYIAIVSSPEYPEGSVNTNKIKISQNFIIAESYWRSGVLVCFDKNGKYFKKISQKGRGPGEYNSIKDVAIDEENDIVYVLSSWEKKIFKYSFQGKFLGAINLSDVADKIDVGSSGRLLVHFPNYSGNLQYSCLLIDYSGKTVNKLQNHIFYNLNSERKIFENEGISYIYNDQIHIKNKSDTLFVVENDQFRPKYIFNTGVKYPNNMMQLEYDQIIPFRYIMETDGKVFFNFRLNQKWYDAYYDKNLRKAFSAPSSIINDMGDSDYFSFIYSDYQYNDKIIKRRNFEFDRGKLKEKVTSEKYITITNMLDRLEDEDPAILSILYLKKSENYKKSLNY